MKPKEVKDLYLTTLDNELRSHLKVALELIKLVEDYGCEVLDLDPFGFFAERPNYIDIDCKNEYGDYDVDKAFACAEALEAYFDKLEAQASLSEEEQKKLFNN